MTAPKSVRRFVLILMAQANYLISVVISAGFMGTTEHMMRLFAEDPWRRMRLLLIGEVIISSFLCLILSCLIFGMVYFLYYRERIRYGVEITKTLLWNVPIALIVASLRFYWHYYNYGYV